MKAKVYLIGAGPGEPSLITVRGLEILRQAEVVIYDYLVDKRILDEAKEGAELICCDKLGKNRYSDGFLIHNEKISKLIVKKVREGKRVIRLKNGDPSIFSRTSQELDSLVKNRIDFEIVPGVTAVSGASAFSGIPLTDRRYASTCIFVTGHEDPRKKESFLNWDKIAKLGTIVLYMAVENLRNIVERLLKAGKSLNTPCAIICDATLLTQKVLIGTLSDIVEKAKTNSIRPPAIIIIGEVVKLEKDFNWLKKSKRILFTGLSPERFFLKGTYFHLPLIKIEPLDDYKEFDNYLKDIQEFDWIVFTSRYGVEYFFQRLKAIKLDVRALSGIKIAAIGNSTATRLLDFSIIADLVPKKESSKGLLSEFRRIALKDKKIFLPRSDLSDKGLTEGLESQGARVTPCVVYRNVMPEDLPDLDFPAKAGSRQRRENFFDEIMFSSPSGVRNFVKRYGSLPLTTENHHCKPVVRGLPRKVKVSCIGEVTRKEAKKYRLVDS